MPGGDEAATFALSAAAVDLRELFAAPDRVAAALAPADVERVLALLRDLTRAPRAALALSGRGAPWGDLPLAHDAPPGVVEVAGVGRVVVVPVRVPLVPGGAGPSRAFGAVAAGPLAAGEAPDPAALARHASTLLVERALARRAERDRLTGLATRPAFERGLADVTARLARGERAALVLVDIDGLRDLNASRGWAAGDDLLGTLGAATSGLSPAPALAGRFGGDEVALVLPGLDAAAASGVVDQLRAALAAAGPTGAPSLSAGVACGPEHGAEGERLLFAADQALAEAKRSGPGRTATWAPALRGSRGRDRLAGVLTGSPQRDALNVQALLEAVAATSRLAPLDQALADLVDRVLDVTGAERGLVLLRPPEAPPPPAAPRAGPDDTDPVGRKRSGRQQASRESGRRAVARESGRQARTSGRQAVDPDPRAPGAGEVLPCASASGASDAGWTVATARRRGRRPADDLAFAASVADEALREGRAVQRLAEDDAPISPSAARIGLRAVLCAPLVGEDVPRGALYVDSRDAGRFDSAALAFFDALAATLVTALRDAALYGRIVERAERLARDVAGREEALVEARRRWERVRAQAAPPGGDHAGLVGEAPPMRELFATLRSLEGTTVPVVIEGESGTGKELVARAIHVRSPRADGPLVTVNCGAIPAGLVESELFGHVKGAFTGAHADRRGLLEAASGGTLFLDELGELPLEAQAKLLRAVQSGELRRVGDDRPRSVDVRFVSATNRDLREAIAAGDFREDLFYRLAVFRLRLPPLRERLQDVPRLMLHLLGALGRPTATVAPDALATLVARRWPGNVRELKNALERALALAGDGPILAEHVRPTDDAADPGAAPGLDPAWFERPLPDARALFTAEYARRVIARAGGSVPAAAKIAGVSRQTLHRALADGERLLEGGDLGRETSLPE